MELKALNEFKELSDRVDSTLTSLAPGFVNLRRADGDLVLHQGNDRLGVLTPRAERNLAHIARINHNLLATLPEDILNDTLRFQLSSVGTLGFLRNPAETSQIVSFLEDTRDYLRYSEILSDLKPEDLTYVRGNPVTDDKVSFLRITGRFTPKDKKEVLAGMHSVMSSTGNAQSRIAQGIFRLVCSNGMISRCMSDENVKTRDLKLMRSVFTSYYKSMEIHTTNLAKVVAKAESTIPQKSRIDEYLSLESFPQTLVKSFKDTINADGREAVLREAGVESKDTLWDWASIMSSLAKGMPSVASRESAEKHIFTWMSAFYKVANN